MTNNDKIVMSIAFTWQGERPVMGVWFACYGKENPVNTAKRLRNWPGCAAFRSMADIKKFWLYAETLPDQERVNIKRGLESLTGYIKRVPEKFSKALQD